MTVDLTVALICATALALAYIGRGAHDLRLRHEGAKMLAARNEQEGTELAELERRVAACEAKAQEAMAKALEANTALALRGGRR